MDVVKKKIIMWDDPYGFDVIFIRTADGLTGQTKRGADEIRKEHQRVLILR